MLIKNSINEKSLNLAFAAFVSLFFGIIILQYDVKAVGLLGLIIFVFIFFIRIEYAFYFILASRSIVDAFYDVEAVGDIRITQYLGVLITALSLFYFIVFGYRLFRLGINKVYGIFMGLSIVPIFFAHDLMTGFGCWLKLLQGFVILNVTILVVLGADDESYTKRMNRVCWSILIAFLIPFLQFVKNYMQGTYTEFGGYARYGITETFGGYANNFSYYLFAAFPICLLFYSISTIRQRKTFWLVSMAVMLLVIYKTYTRNVWIGITVMLFMWNIARRNFKVIFPTFGIVCLIIVFSSDVRDRFKDIFEILHGKSFFDLDYRLLSFRIGIWQGNLFYFLHDSTLMDKLLGNGFGAKIKVARYLSFSPDPVDEHNNYLTLLMNTGICGLFMYCLYNFKLFQESFKLLRRTKDVYFRNLAQTFISVLFAYVIICFFTHMLWKINFQYYFSSLAGLVIAANILEEKKEYNLISKPCPLFEG